MSSTITHSDGNNPDTQAFEGTSQPTLPTPTQWSYFTESVAWCSLVVLFVLSLWRPADSAVAIGFGDSIWHIGISLIGFFSAALFASSLGRFGSSQRLSLLWLLIALVVLWHAMATGHSLGRTNARNAIYGFWQSTAMWLVLPTVAWVVRTPQDAAKLLKLWWVLAVFVIAWGFWEYGVLQPAQRADLAADRAGFLVKNKIDPDSSAAVLIINRIESTEVLSVFALANSYAGFLVALWPIWLGWLLQSIRFPSEIGDADSVQPKPNSRRYSWLIPLALVVATGLALLLTKSRTAWVAAGISTILAMLLDPVLRSDLAKWIKSYPLALIVVPIALVAIFGGVYALDPLIFQEAGKSLSYRMDYWRGAWELIGQQPVYGYGSLNFQPTYLQVKKITASETPADPHNFLLELAHSGGWVLLTLTAFLLLMLCYCGLRQRILPTASSHNPFAQLAGNEKRPSSLAFRATLILAGILVFAYSFLTSGDNELIGTAASIALATAFAYWLSRPQTTASVQSLVKNQPVLLLVSFLGVMVHFMASGGWMFPGTMIAPIVAMGLWVSGTKWLEPIDAPAQTNRFAKWQGPAVAALLLGLWGWSMAWPYAQVQRITNTYQKDAAGRLKIDSAIADKSFVSSDQYASWITSVPNDPDLVKWGLELSASVLESNLPTSEKIAWLHQFQEACKLLIERDPKHSMAYAEAATQSLRASIGQMLDPSLNEDLALRRQGGGPPLRAAGGGGGRPRGAGGSGGPGGGRTVATMLLQDSLKYFQEATKVAPANAELQLQTAVVAAMQGNWKVCQAMLDQAEEVDRETPHRDRKIEAAKIWIPKEMVQVLEERAKSGGKIVQEGNPQWDQLKVLLSQRDSVPGEPVRQTLRSFFSNP